MSPRVRMKPNVLQPQPLGRFPGLQRAILGQGGLLRPSIFASVACGPALTHLSCSSSASNKLFLGGLSWTTTEGKATVTS